MSLSQEEIFDLIVYSPEDGLFRWAKSRRGVRAGDVAGTMRPDGYIQIGINKKGHLAHRLVWLYIHGRPPLNDIDHINRVRHDNRLANLREATRAENLQNISVPCTNKSGAIGVRWHKLRKKWAARIFFDGKEIYLGLFDNKDDAIAARLAAKEKYHTFNKKDVQNG